MSIKDIPQEVKKILCQIKVTLGDGDNTKKLECFTSEDLTIDYDNVEFELEHMPHIFNLWSNLYSEVKEQANVVDKQIRRRKGILTAEILEEWGKSLSRGTIAELIECDDTLTNLEGKHIRLQKLAGKLYFTLEALRMKNENMRSLSGFKKIELQNS